MDRKKWLALAVLCYGLAVVLQLVSPNTLDNRDQARQGLYILDIVQGGPVFLPRSRGVEPATKPPLYNWVAAVISLAWGDVTDVTIRLPSVLCGLGVVVFTFLMGETLFSARTGFLAALVLILNSHFAGLSFTARTDMMLCLFVTLALYAFLLGYRRQNRSPVYFILMFVCLGCGLVTKGPVVLIALLVIFVFLLVERDLKSLKSMRFGWGFAIMALFLLGWFVPAAVQGGREFVDTVVLDEMVNRFLGIGTRAEKTRPFYNLWAAFFGKYLPWSLFVPGALVWFWRSRQPGLKDGLRFPVVWFVTILAFFSVCRQTRSDYLLPLYPAASVIVAQFWLSVMGTQDSGRWLGYLRIVSVAYLAGLLLTTIGLALLIGGVAGQGRDSDAGKLGLLAAGLKAHVPLFLLIAVPTAAVSLAGILAGLKRRSGTLLATVFLSAALMLCLYFGLLSNRALTRDGQIKKDFCMRAARKVDARGDLQFCDVKLSILFYMKKNVLPLEPEAVPGFFRGSAKPYLITTEAHYELLKDGTDVELVVLERSEYLPEREASYVLLGKRTSDANPE